MGNAGFLLGRFDVEYQIAPHLKQRIDVVNVVNGIAYELKVSPNNVHMEFYRDIFKVILARDNRLPNLERFVFLTPERSAAKLRKGMGQAVIRDGVKPGLVIEVIGLAAAAVPASDQRRLAKMAEIEGKIKELQSMLAKSAEA